MNCDEKSEKMSIVDISLKEITFCSHTNEDISNLRMIIKAIEGKESVEFEFKKIESREMRSVDVIGLIDEEKIMIGQLMMQKEGSRGYIVRKMTRWRDLKRDFYEVINERYDGCKLKDLNKMGKDECDGWGELMSDGG